MKPACSFLVRLSDPSLMEEASRPMVFWYGDGVSILPKDHIVCDLCNRIADPETDWANIEKTKDGWYFTRVVCEECRVKYKYYCSLSMFDTLDEAQKQACSKGQRTKRPGSRDNP